MVMISRRQLLNGALLASIVPGAGAQPAAGPDDAAVYVAFLNTIVQSSDKAEDAGRTVTLVVHPESLVVERGSHMPASVEEVLQIMQGLDRLAAADLVSKLAQSTAIALALTMLDARLHVIQPQASDIDEIFANRGPFDSRWKKFDQRFKAAQSLVRLSAVGYNPQFDEAVFFVSITCGPLCGAGALIQARKTAAGWHVTDQQGLWVS
ncbi:hypothetical protein [Ideonella sp.]|uniref:hypothetical protein n=1 Tax=Ideonella sp. TaxID=1929293 RepID=UPI0035ADEAE9